MAKCEDCKKSVTETVEKYSKEHFEGRVLCVPCQDKVRAGGSEGQEGKKEEEKGTLGSFGSGAKEDEELGEYDREVAAELEAELKELDAKIIETVTAMSVPDESKFHAWLESEYGVKRIDELALQDKRKVLEETKRLADKMGDGKVIDAEVVKEEGPEWKKTVEIDKGTFAFHEEDGKLLCKSGDNVYELHVSVPDCTCPDFQINKEKNKWCNHLKAASIAGYKVTKLMEIPKEVSKEINIEWGKIPPHILLSKLERALNYEIIKEEGDGAFRVIMIEGGVIHYVSQNSCDCRDWINRGTSLNPCVHQVRIRYDDDEINEKLKELQPNIKSEQLPVIKQKQQPSVFGGISQLQPRLCETGKIKIGELSDKRTGSGRRLPKKLDHFVITTLLRDEEGNLLLDEEMAKKIGEDCKELDIYLCYDSPELNMPTFYAYFTQSKLRCMGDGKTALKTKDDGGKEEITCNPKTCDAYKKKLCKPYGRLSVILSQANRIGGAYIFRTTSWNTLRNILTSMSFIRTITGGILAGLPLKMRLIPMQVQPRDLGHTVRIYMVNIEFNGDMEQLMESAEVEAKRRIQMGTDMRQIEAGDRAVIAERVREEAEEQAAEIAEEFVPDK